MAKRADPTNLIGKGGGGGASEIAAVSVGVYAQDNTGPGFAQVKANAAAAGTEIGTELAGTPGGQKGILGGLARAKKQFTKVITGAFAIPFVATMAFKVGQEVREAFERGMESSGEKGRGLVDRILLGSGADSAKGSLKEVQAELTRINAEFAAKIEGTDPSTTIGQILAARNAKLKAPLMELEKSLLSQIKAAEQASKTRESELAQVRAYADAYKMAGDAVEQFRQIEKEAADERAKEQQAFIDGYEQMSDAVRRYREEQELANEEGAAMGSEALDRFKELRSLIDSMESRRSAASDHGFNSIDTNVAQLRNMVRTGMRQRFPDPGSGEAH